MITAWTDDYKIQYSFRNGRLYKVEMARDYQSRKAFREGFATIRTDYNSSHALVMDLSTEVDAASYVVLEENELHEVYQVTVGKKGYQLRQVVLDLDACSRDEMVALEQNRAFGTLLQAKP